MFKKENRLTGKLSKTDRTINSSLFTLKIAGNNKNLSRFGFVVPKKIDKRAVIRNKIKRKFRLCLEENMSGIKTGHDFLFIIRKDIEGTKYCEEVQDLLKKEGFLK